MRNRKNLLVLAGLSLTPGLGQATELPGGIDFSGYVDVAYSDLDGKGVFNTTPGAGVTLGGPNRVFDYRPDTGTFHQLAVTLAKQPKEGLGGLLNLTAGKDADVIASYKTDPQDGSGCNLALDITASGRSCDKDHFDVTQAFLQYATGPFTVIAGKFVTSAGAEVIASPSNTNYSRSILFGYAIPFAHTGLRASYAASETLTLIAGVNQGWDAIKDTNSKKTAELGVSLAPTKTFSLIAMGHFGKERAGGLVKSGPEGQRNLVDLVATFRATDQLTLVLNYDYATQKNATSLVTGGPIKATWSGVAGYANYQINDAWRVSLRAEYFDDEDGYRTGVIQEWKEATLTLGWTPIQNLELRAEVRGDRSDVRAFVEDNGLSASKSQNSFALQAIYKF